VTKRLYVFDTTLRDGEQSPGVSLNIHEKLQIARQLAKLGVDIIEAGFPIASPGDFRGVQAVAREVRGVTVAALARASFQDIDRAWEAIQDAEQPRIHTFIATSDIHLKHKLRKSREEVLEATAAAVARAKQYTSDVEFSAEDAYRSDIDFLCQVLGVAIKAGATVLNVPDTVGYATPDEFGAFIRKVCANTPGIENTIVSVHCHNDLGLAVANSLAAVANGARQVEGTINGIGERAGNAALEEVIMTLHTHRERFQLETRIVTEEIYRSSKLISMLTGMPVQFNKAVVGKNAFLHESGIHQDGMLKERTTYEIMNPAMIGITDTNLVLGKHSGRHAFRERLTELGYGLTAEELDKAFVRFKELADTKKQIGNEDLEAIVEEQIRQIPVTYELDYLHIFSGTTVKPTAVIGLLIDGEFLQEAACGNGPVDAIFKALEKATNTRYDLVSYVIDAVTGGTDALANVTLKVSDPHQKVVTGRGMSTDVLEASARAYINVLNKIRFDEKPRKQDLST